MNIVSEKSVQSDVQVLHEGFFKYIGPSKSIKSPQ